MWPAFSPPHDGGGRTGCDGGGRTGWLGRKVVAGGSMGELGAFWVLILALAVTHRGQACNLVSLLLPGNSEWLWS